ncbi:putative methyltransferase METT10D [Trichinella spiralis]|uniref:putative methyltransferase METT10D n=1 Tax=Trichinella spiralis TaxID=6334 RepID=UPI0001EFBCA3|nr:putative methyltransferase METT10D [Trichinella spiralis]
MNFNRRMHPRNFYRNNPPNFAELALQYPDFRQHCAIDIYGKVNFNFKNPDAIRALTNVLLKKDFGLSIEIPPDSLVPRIPGRLNYIHWLQDLAASHFPDESVRCIDIGSGASCIYPLLGAKMFYKRHDPVFNVGSSVRFVVEAYNNTWSHSRRKRRALRHAEGEADNKMSRKSHCVTHDVGVNCTTMVELFSDEEQNFNSDGQSLQIMQNEQKQSSSSTGIDKFVQTEKSQPSFAVIKFEVLVKEMVAGLEMEFIFIDGKSPEMLSHIVQYFKNSMNALV